MENGKILICRWTANLGSSPWARNTQHLWKLRGCLFNLSWLMDYENRRIGLLWFRFVSLKEVAFPQGWNHWQTWSKFVLLFMDNSASTFAVNLHAIVRPATTSKSSSCSATQSNSTWNYLLPSNMLVIGL